MITVLMMKVRDYSLLYTSPLCSPKALLQVRKREKKKYSINKERRRESGGRDGNGKKDEVSPMGEVRADLLKPSNILHLLTYVLHHFSFQGETTARGEIKKEEPT